MEEFIVEFSDKKEISFTDFLKLYRVWYRYHVKKAEKEIKVIEDKLFNFKIEEVDFKTMEEVYFSYKEGIYLNGKNLDSQRKESMQVSYDAMANKYNVYSREVTIKFDEISSLRNISKSIKFSQKFKIKDTEFQVNVEIPEYKRIWPINKYLSIQVKSPAKLDIYYYNLETGKICILKKDKYMEVSPHMQTAILSLLPTVLYNDLSADFRKIVKSQGEDVYRLNDGTIHEGFPSLLERITNAPITTGKRFTIEEAKKEKVQPTFQEIATGKENYSLETSTNTKEIIENIKALLTRLKESKIKLENTPKIKISDSLFFSSITNEKKEIDSFFKDPKIIKYCDLSAIDFTNADIRGAYLADSGAQIDLANLYNKSIEDANLEGVPLYGQELDGINANGANLIRTGVCVSVDRTSIIGTKFSDSSVFMLGMSVLSMEQVKALGISVIEEKEEIDLKLNEK